MVVKFGLGVSSGVTLSLEVGFFAAGMIRSVSVTTDIALVVGCVVAVMSLEYCGMELGVLWTSTVCCLLVSVLVRLSTDSGL